mgnify:CR=1 FL=1
MRALVRREMEAGALGIGSSLIYAPAFYASTEELIELCRVAAGYRGKYISHIRSEGSRLLEGIDELIRISREAGMSKRTVYTIWDSRDALFDALVCRMRASVLRPLGRRLCGRSARNRARRRASR